MQELLAYPILPLRDIVVFPSMIAPLFVGRKKSVSALEEVANNDRKILLVTQKDPNQDNPNPEDIHTVGTISAVLQLLKLPDGTVKILVEGIQRAQLKGYTDNKAYLEAYAEPIADVIGESVEIEALSRSVIAQFENYIKLNKKISSDVLSSLSQIEDPIKLVDTVASHLAIKLLEKQNLLTIPSVEERLKCLLAFMEEEISVLQVEKRIRGRVKRQMEKTQREYYLNEQMKAIQKELGEGEDGRDEVSELEKRVAKTKLSKEAREKAKAEIKKLRSMSSMSAEATVIRNYLDWMLSIPWKKPTAIKHDIKKAEKTLDEDHYGLEKIKERIIEYLAVQQRVMKMKGPILCLVGPPGVGKTSLGKSLARATGRNFVRISLGGVRDEAEIRGHRRTYIGSLPGKIIQGMKKAKSSNPLFMLDEIDKIGSDWRGDPAAALLEILDPEQNHAFNDHYLEVDYDLSDVMFVTTANTLRMPRPLLDRMEIIRIAGYTEEDKIAISNRHLIPKQLKEHGLKKTEWSVNDEGLRLVIRSYTREAGVRSLEREIASLARKAIKDILVRDVKRVRFNTDNIEKYLGVPRFRASELDSEDLIGVSVGLAWTEVGGELLSIEAVTLAGKGQVTSTGKLGDVMRESISAAESYVKSRSPSFGIVPEIFQKRDIHVHVPEGATPKDGPSAGVAMVTSIVSVLTGIPVKRDVAMTGEITLRGRVLPIGGLKEKLIAALRAGVKTVLIPRDNEKDLTEIPDNIKESLEIIAVSLVDEVLEKALSRPIVPIPWEETTEEGGNTTENNDLTKREGILTH